MKRARVASAVLVASAIVAALAGWRTGRLLLDLWRHQANSAVVRPVAVVWALLAAAVVLLLAGLRLRPARRADVALALVSAAAATYGLEALLALRPTPAERRLEERLRVLDELRARGEDASPGVEPVRFVRAREASRPAVVSIDGSDTLPLGSLANRTIVACREGDRDWMIYRTDEHGFHNPPGAWKRARLQIAAVGDSFTMGACVPSEDNMVAHLRRRFPSTLNLGMAGSGPLTMLALLREYLGPLRPQVVLWCHYSGNDLVDLRREMGHPILVRYLEEGFTQGLAARQARLDPALAEYAERHITPMLRRQARRRPAAVDLLALTTLRARLGLLHADPYGLSSTDAEKALFRTILGRAKTTVEGWGGRLVFVHLPPWSEPPRQLGEAESARVQEAMRRDVLAEARRLGLQVADVERAFHGHAAPATLFACPGCHYGPEGYRLAAETVLDVLESAPPRP